MITITFTINVQLPPPALVTSAFSFCTSLSFANSGSVNSYCSSCLFQNDARKKVQDLELELSKRQAERDHFSACNQELQKQLSQCQEGTALPFQSTDPILSQEQGFLVSHRKSAVPGGGRREKAIEHEICP